jgi:hypothetical protein
MSLLALLLVGCTTVHGVRPVGKGAVALEGSFGGPITEVYGAPLPIPFSAVGATYGASDRVDLHAAWHPSPALFFNLAAGDLGASYVLLGQSGIRPRVMGDLTLTFVGGDNEAGGAEGGFRVFVQPTANAAWDWGKHRRQTVYGGLTLFAQPFPGVHALPAVTAGHWWGLGRTHLVTELKWVAPTESSRDLVPHYYAPGDLGAVELQLGFRSTFGGAE